MGNFAVRLLTRIADLYFGCGMTLQMTYVSPTVLK
jgi:hypothetical protein